MKIQIFKAWLKKDLLLETMKKSSLKLNLMMMPHIQQQFSEGERMLKESKKLERQWSNKPSWLKSNIQTLKDSVLL